MAAPPPHLYLPGKDKTIANYRRQGVPVIFTGPPLENAHLRRRFQPPDPSTRPLDLFKPAVNRCSFPGPRFIRTDDISSILMFIDGSALSNGLPEARAGFAVVFRPNSKGELVTVKGRLELMPGTQQTSNRAELRAALAALEMRVWYGEGFGTVVLATDSEYVVLGACERVEKWRKRGWRTAKGSPVQNKDLWEMLVEKLEDYEGKGVSIQFWLIPREWNTEADRGAKEAAAMEHTTTEYAEVIVAAC